MVYSIVWAPVNENGFATHDWQNIPHFSYAGNCSDTCTRHTPAEIVGKSHKIIPLISKLVLRHTGMETSRTSYVAGLNLGAILALSVLLKLRYKVNLNDMQRKLKRFPHEVKQIVNRLPARVLERIHDLVYFIRTGRVKMNDDIRRYAEETGVVSDIHPDDLIFRFVVEFPGFRTREEAVKYYFYDGANSAKKLANLLFSLLGVKRGADTSFLEFASGYGCVTRHLIRTLAPVNMVSCDIHSAACTFIESTMGVKTLRSATKPEDLEIENESFDVVFALSFFSHMPEHTWGRWLKSLFDKVKPGGYLVFTTHGMTTWENLGKPRIPDAGIWFAPSSEQKDLDVEDYGSTIVTPEFVNRAVENILHQSVLRMDAADWWGHQDLYVVRNPWGS